MSYQVLARKWRPTKFSEMVGQSHVVKTLSTALELDRIHHAYLFTGTRGVGKTTIARIMARCLNCETGVGQNPCGECSTCVEIDEGRFVDLIEVDAASKTKIDDTRELLENVQYRPSRGKYKIYLIDEVHMLSKHSFNALLKTLEEPPPHVIFLLATTDPQMLPATVLSRCLQFHLKNMTTDEIANHMDHILSTEAIEYEDKAIQALASSAKGSMRDGLSLLDQAIAYGQGKVIANDVKEMLGTIDHDHIEQLLTLLAQGDMSAILSLFDTMDEFAPNYAEVLDQIILALHQIALQQEVPASEVMHFNAEAISSLANQMDAADVQLFYQIALLAKRDLYLAPSQRAGLEMCLLRMNSFRPDTNQTTAPAQGGSDAVKKPLSSSLEASKPNSENTATSAPADEIDPSTVEQYMQAMASDDEDVEPVDVEPVDVEAITVDVHIAATDEITQQNKAPTPFTDWSGNSILKPRKSDSEAVDTQDATLGAPIETPVITNESRAASTPFVDHTTNKTESVAESPVESEDYLEPELISEPPSFEVGQSTLVDESTQVAEADVLPQTQSEEEHTTNLTPNDGKSLNEIKSLSDLSPGNWYQVLKQLDSTGLTEQILLATQVESTDNNELKLHCEAPYWEMLSAEQINQISVDLHNYLSFDFKIKIEAQHPTSETPGQRRQRLRREQLEAATQNLQADPVVQALQKKFAANLDLQSIKPISPIID